MSTPVSFASPSVYAKAHRDRPLPARDAQITGLYNEIEGEGKDMLRVEFLPGGVTQDVDTIGNLVAVHESWTGVVHVVSTDVRLGDVTREFLGGERAKTLRRLADRATNLPRH